MQKNPLVNLSVRGMLLIAAVVVSVVLQKVHCSANDGYYNGYGSLLHNVPDDIPDNTTFVNLMSNYINQIRATDFAHLHNLREISLRNNRIALIEDGAFENLRRLVKLNLYVNPLFDLTDGMFRGLVELDELNLEDTKTTTIESGTFRDMSKLRFLYLGNNRLEEIRGDMFTGLVSLQRLDLFQNSLTTISPDALSQLPRPLQLPLSSPKLLNNNPLQCDSDLCWLKQEEDAALPITWYRNSVDEVFKPICVNGIDWDSWDCTSQGLCHEPGILKFSTRSGATWPYLENSEVTYTCVSCYSGGGTITCQSDGQWTTRPYCSPTNCGNSGTPDSVCDEPGGLTNAVRTGAVWPYEVNSKVTYTCNTCYTGGETITCQSNGQWTTRPACTAVDCADPGTPSSGCREPGGLTNAVRSGATSPYDVNSQVTYTCNHGYTGGGTVVCQIDGLWTNAEPCRGTGIEGSDHTSQTPTDETDNLGLILGVVLAMVVVIAISVVVVVICLKRPSAFPCLNGNKSRNKNMDQEGYVQPVAPSFPTQAQDTSHHSYAEIQPGGTFN